MDYVCSAGDFCDCALGKVTGRLIADVVHALESLTVLPSRLETPCWIGGEKSLSLPEKF